MLMLLTGRQYQAVIGVNITTFMQEIPHFYFNFPAFLTKFLVFVTFIVVLFMIKSLYLLQERSFEAYVVCVISSDFTFCHVCVHQKRQIKMITSKDT